MAKDKTTIQSPDPGVGTPPRDSNRSLDVVHTEIAIIRNESEHTKSLLAELKTDMREMRDRMAKLEVKVDHLPSKGFTVVVVTTIFLIANGALLLLSRLLPAAGTGH